MPLIICLLILSFSTSAIAQSKAETELITGKLIDQLENLEEDYIVKLKRSDYTRAKEIIAEIYSLLESLKQSPSHAMEADAFSNLLNRLKKESFSSGRIDILRSAAERNNFTVHQVNEVLETLSYSDERIKAVELLYPWIIDNQDSLLLLDAIVFESEKEAFKKTIERSEMSSEEIKYGKIGWIDLTVPDAGKLKEFYSKVAGWNAVPLSMGDYDDYVMSPSDEGDAAAGICHARGVNEGLPPYWMIYINVRNIEESVTECRKMGGEIIKEIRNMGDYGKFAVIKDPAGAYAALFEPVVK
jgi:uncharacterized protein